MPIKTEQYGPSSLINFYSTPGTASEKNLQKTATALILTFGQSQKEGRRLTPRRMHPTSEPGRIRNYSK